MCLLKTEEELLLENTCLNFLKSNSPNLSNTRPQEQQLKEFLNLATFCT